MNPARYTCIWLTVAFISASTLLTACEKNPEGNENVAAPLEISVVQVQQKSVPVNYEFVGQTKGSIDAEIRARVEGVIQTINFEEGKEVTEGQLLYTIDPAPFNAKVAEAQGKLAEAETKLTKAIADLGRIKPLAEMNAVSKRDLDSAIAQDGAARAGVEAAKAALQSAEIELGYTNITSPTSGTIGLTKAKIGEFVGRAPNPVVLNTVSKMDPINVRFNVNEKEYLYFARQKQKEMDGETQAKTRVLELILADGSKHSDPGKLASVDRQIDAQTGAIAVEAEFPNPHKLVRPGQFARIEVLGETVDNAILIPKKAIVDIQGTSQVYVVKPDNTVEQRQIELSRELGDMQIVASGLSPNEKVAVDGLQRLRQGMTVKSNLIAAPTT